MSSTSYTSLSDHCNLLPSSRSVIHSQPLVNILFDVSDRDLPVLTSGNCVIKDWVISGLWNYTYVCYSFFSKSKKAWLFTFFQLNLMHTFSRTLL